MGSIGDCYDNGRMESFRARMQVELLNRKLNEVVQSAEFKARMAALGMVPPPAADNTPEKYDAFMRKEIVRQGELAKLAKEASPEPPK